MHARASGAEHYRAARDGGWPAHLRPPSGADLPAGWEGPAWIRESISRDVSAWRGSGRDQGLAAAHGARDRPPAIGFIWMGHDYPLRADSMGGLRLTGAWMAVEDGATPNVVVVGHANSYLWAQVTEEGGARLRTTFPEVTRLLPGREGAWGTATHLAAETGRRSE